LQPDIRHLTADHLGAAFALSSTAGWNQRLDDWEMLGRIAPAGSFCAIAGGRLIGTAIGINYGGFGWIAMMLVDPSWRGRGVGARLLEAAMDSLPPELPIRLDATPLGRPLYQKSGFHDEVALTRYVAGADRGRLDGGSSPSSPSARPMQERDLATIREVDRPVFLGDRGAVLQWALALGPQYAHVTAGEGGPQYCFGRSGRLFDQIGPVVAENQDAARGLLTAALAAAAGRSAVVDAFDEHGDFSGWLGGQGFTPQRPLFRMRRDSNTGPAGGGRVAGSGLREFAIFGPEFA
jgi:GNAT superfamily N-acetyltransferase